MNRLFNIGVVCSAILVAIPFAIQDQDNEKKQDPDRIVIPSDDDNAVARRDFMRTKLMFSQKVFEGLTTGNFDLIKTGVKEIEGITEGEKWVAIDNDFYRKLTEEFKTTTKRLKEAAESGNIEATAMRYYQMSTSCIDCHQHIRKAQYEF